ncbi:MAG: hypothetical protein WD491_12525 [Balneolales bacterium]
MRYLVTGRIKQNKSLPLLRAIQEGTLGKGSIAGGEYIRDMKQARLLKNKDVCWVEVCFCPKPLMEEIPYWEEYFELTDIRDAHSRKKCKDENGEEPWACSNCDCTNKLERKMQQWGKKLLDELK